MLIDSHHDRLLIAAFKPFATRGEGKIKYFYGDTTKNVTIGKGHIVPNEQAALALKEKLYIGNRHPTEAEIISIYKSVKNKTIEEFNRTGGNTEQMAKASAYEKINKGLEIDGKYIEKLFDNDIRTHLEELKRKFPDLHTYPAPAQTALLDMSFNMGMPTFKAQFTLFMAAVYQRDWAAELERMAPFFKFPEFPDAKENNMERLPYPCVFNNTCFGD